MKRATKAQLTALLRLYNRVSNKPAPTFLAFRRAAQWECCGDALLVQWCGMWVGIEPDGYTHS